MGRQDKRKVKVKAKAATKPDGNGKRKMVKPTLGSGISGILPYSLKIQVKKDKEKRDKGGGKNATAQKK